MADPLPLDVKETESLQGHWIHIMMKPNKNVTVACYNEWKSVIQVFRRLNRWSCIHIITCKATPSVSPHPKRWLVMSLSQMLVRLWCLGLVFQPPTPLIWSRTSSHDPWRFWGTIPLVWIVRLRGPNVLIGSLSIKRYSTVPGRLGIPGSGFSKKDIWMADSHQVSLQLFGSSVSR